QAFAGFDRVTGGGPAPADLAAPATEALSIATPDLARAALSRLGLAGGAVAAFLSRLTIAPSPGSRAVAITFVARDPGLAARGANTVADLVVQSRNEA